jgi:ATP-binding cassette subfamily B (MDR/TAP) protein 1
VPTTGEILIDGVPIDQLNLRWLRQQIGVVSQEPVLFNRTIYENILYGLTDAYSIDEKRKKELVEEACKLANAHDFITKLPDGYQVI